MATYNERGRLKYVDTASNTYNLFHPLERAEILEGGSLNDVPVNSLYLLTTGYSYTNLPDDSNAGNASWLFTYGAATGGAISLQLLYIPLNSNKVYMRRCASNSNWYSWTEITAQLSSIPDINTDSDTALAAQTFARYGLQYGYVIDGTRYTNVSSAGFTSLNDVPGNTILVCNLSQNVQNVPSDATSDGWVITIGYFDSSVKSARFQIYLATDANAMYLRHYNSQTWGDWNTISPKSTLQPSIDTDSDVLLAARTFARYGMQYGYVVDETRYTNVSTAGFTSLDDVPGNTILVCNVSRGVENIPPTNSDGWVITIGYFDASVSSARLQIYMTTNADAMYVRHYNSQTWGDWSNLSESQSFANYGLQYGYVVDGTRYTNVSAAGFTSLDDVPGNTILVSYTGYDVENMPEETTGWVITMGGWKSVLSTYARIQFWIKWDGTSIYFRNYSPSTGWASWTMLNEKTGMDASDAKMYSIGNSLLSGSVWVNDAYDHTTSYKDSPYGCIANAVGISESNETHTLISSTGILYDAGNGNFRDRILAADVSDYDILVTHAWFDDLASKYEFGDIDSTDSDTLCGAIRAIVDHCREQNPAMHVVIVSPQVVSSNDRATDAPFDYKFGDGYTRREIDEMLHEMADKYHFIYVDWQDYDPAYHWKDFVDTNNVHACKDSYYRSMGGYLGGRVSAEVRF